MGGCQSSGPFLDPYYNTAPNIEYPKRDHLLSQIQPESQQGVGQGDSQISGDHLMSTVRTPVLGVGSGSLGSKIEVRGSLLLVLRNNKSQI